MTPFQSDFFFGRLKWQSKKAEVTVQLINLLTVKPVYIYSENSTQMEDRTSVDINEVPANLIIYRISSTPPRVSDSRPNFSLKSGC
jgi:hypothetical protein